MGATLLRINQNQSQMKFHLLIATIMKKGDP